MPRSYEPGCVSKDITGSDEYIVASDTGTYFGLAIHETGGSNTGTVVIKDKNSGTTGHILDILTLAAGGATYHWCGPTGVAFINGIHLDYSGTGTLAGCVYYMSDS